MTNVAPPANFGSKRPVIDADDVVMPLIDHQSGLFGAIGAEA